uniref:Uncharacterized protein n=1 Tax=Periophthalmus magnuspinnatus TaxID=409849 RepID=A0A3B4B2R2_9GOBI
MATVLLQALERTELNKLPKGIQNKLERFVTQLQNANEALKTERERLKADSEQQYFDIERRLAETQEQFFTSTKDLQTVKEENKKLSTIYPLGATKTKHEIEAEKKELARLLEKRTQEVENLNEDLTRLNEKLVETNKVKMDLQLKLDNIQSSEASLQHREKHMAQEKELLQQKIDWLTSELKAKTNELLETNREKGKQIVELQSSLQTCKEDVSRLEIQLTSLKNTSESQTKRAEDLNNKLKKEQCAMEEKYRNELNAHIKLSSLYKSAASDMEAKNKELNRAVEGLSKMMQETGEANKVLEKKVSETEEQKTRLDAELREKIKKMEKELENVSVKFSSFLSGAQSLTEEQLDAMCPSAAAIAAIVKPGMKFFDLYNAYAECQTQLQLEKQETRRVNRVLDEIVQEIESKAPVLKRQREEYESMQRSMASLCNKLEQARSVCTLLMELEEARQNPMIKNEGSSAMEESRSQQVSFRSIQELQQQNQNLLKRLKELEDEKNKKQTISELEVSVDKLQKETEQLKEQRNQQKQLADSNARQRDMYKALLTQSTGYTLPPQGPESASQSAQVRPSVPPSRSMPQRAAAAESAQTAQAKAALKQLSDSFILYKKEKAENDRMLNETNERLQKQLSELFSRNAKLTSQLDFNIKRYDMLQDNLAAYRREIAALQDRNKKMATTAQSQEHVILTMSQDLRQANEKLALEEVRVQNLTKEKEMLRQAESRLGKEKEAILIEQRNQNLLLANLKTIQLTMERTETDSRQRLNNKIEKLESELTAMKTKLIQEVAQRHALGRSMDAQLLEAKKQLETQNTLQQKTRELLRSSEQQVAALKAQVASAPTVSEQELSEIKGQLRTAEEQKNELQEQLKNANATVEQYRAVVLTLEDSLKKEKESRTPLEIRLKESQEVQKQLEQRIVEVEKMKLQEEEERRKAVEAVEKQVIELQRSLKASQTEQQEALERCTLAVTQEEKAIQESHQQTRFAEEAQAKYEKELMLHAADVEVLHDLKKRFQEISTTKQEVEDKLNKTTALLQEKTATWSTVEKQLKENLSNESRRCEELVKQNSLLHQQMDELAAKCRSQQDLQQQNLDLSFSEEGKTTEQILEILRFVRREKEIALARFETSEGEALRYKQRVEYQDQELKELHEALNAERERVQTTAKTVIQLEQQLKKTETISAVQETNRLLKLDKDKLEHELRIFRSKVSKLQSDIAPLHQNLSALSEKNGSLQADKRILEEDLKRWKAKAQQLANQQKDGDVEEKQKLITERDTHLKRITHLTEEGAKLKTELAKANVSNNSAQSQLQALKDTVARLTTERDNAKKDLETKNHDIQEKNKTITQVKKIGRRYKTQYEELKAQHDKCKSREEQLRQQMADKEEKTKKAFLGAKTKISQLNSAKEQLSKELEELKQDKEEQEVRMNAIKSQYEMRLVRLDRELRELRENQTEPREEPQDQGAAKGDQARPSDQRQISLKSPAQDRGSSCLSEPPTANIRPTPSTPSPSSKPTPTPGSKATPRASIRPMVTPPSVPTPTPTATVMPTTQADSQEGKSLFNNLFFTVSLGTGSSVHSTSSSLSNTPTTIAQPTSSQATAFVQPTQQQSSNQEPGSSMEAERPSTSSASLAPGKLIHFDYKQTVIVLKIFGASSEADPPRDLLHLPPHSSVPTPSPSSLAPRLPQPRRPPHSVPPRLYIQPPAPELGPPHTQRQSSQLRRQSVGRGLQLTPGIGSTQQHFFDDDDRMVPSTPTLVVPHRNDGFAEAIHSPQVAGLSTRFRFGPPEDLLPQASASHSDLGQLASQGGLGMYESPLFLAAHDEDGGGRSVPTTPLQVAAPVTVFTESLPSDGADNMASQSVPMVTASTAMSAAADDGDEVFMEHEAESAGLEPSLDSQADMDSAAQQSEDAALPSTSQDPGI